jgi:hypothetical protein
MIGRQTSGATSIPAPVGGLNDRDSIAAMPPQDAVILTNWWPEPSKVSVRKGYTEWSTGYANPVETVVEYCPPDGINELFAASGGSIFDATTQGPVGAPVVTGQTNNRWQDASITTPGGSFLYLFNGVDKPQLYDGTDWTAIDAASTPAITGVTTTLLVQGCVFKNRLFMTERNSMRVWYLDVQSIGGAATALDFGAVFQRGGSIVGVFTWTLDAGAGADDHAVIISDQGEVAVYAGTDPSDVNSWSLIGVFYIGKPIGRRCCTKFGGDLQVICEQGVYPLGKALLSSSVARYIAITDKINNSVSNAVMQYGNNFGWELCAYPAQNAIILNIPAGSGANYQNVMNTISGAWTKFSGWDARTIRNTSLGLMFGDSNSVKLAWRGNIDGETMITADALQSFQYFGSPALNKSFTMVQPYIQSNGNPSILYSINGDFIPQDPTGVLSFTAPGGMVWGSMFWGSMVWGGSMRPISGWKTVGGIYRAAAIRMKVQSNLSDVEWAMTSYVYEKGGVL